MGLHDGRISGKVGYLEGISLVLLDDTLQKLQLSPTKISRKGEYDRMTTSIKYEPRIQRW